MAGHRSRGSEPVVPSAGDGSDFRLVRRHCGIPTLTAVSNALRSVPDEHRPATPTRSDVVDQVLAIVAAVSEALERAVTAG